MWKQEQYNKNRDQLGLTEPHHNRPFQSSPIRTPLAENTKKQKRTQKAFNIDLLALLILETMLDLFPSLQVTRQELEKVISEFFKWIFTSRHFPTTSRHFPTPSRHFPTFPTFPVNVPTFLDMSRHFPSMPRHFPSSSRTNNFPTFPDISRHDPDIFRQFRRREMAGKSGVSSGGGPK